MVDYKPFLKLVEHFKRKQFDRSVFIYQWEREQERQGLIGLPVFVAEEFVES